MQLNEKQKKLLLHLLIGHLMRDPKDFTAKELLAIISNIKTK